MPPKMRVSCERLWLLHLRAVVKSSLYPVLEKHGLSFLRAFWLPCPPCPGSFWGICLLLLASKHTLVLFPSCMVWFQISWITHHPGQPYGSLPKWEPGSRQGACWWLGHKMRFPRSWSLFSPTGYSLRGISLRAQRFLLIQRTSYGSLKQHKNSTWAKTAEAGEICSYPLWAIKWAMKWILWLSRSGQSKSAPFLSNTSSTVLSHKRRKTNMFPFTCVSSKSQGSSCTKFQWQGRRRTESWWWW